MTKGESIDKSPYGRLRVGKIVAVYSDSGAGGTPSESDRPLDRILGTAKIEWLDWAGGRDLVQLAFPSFSNPVADGGDADESDVSDIGLCYGDLSLPSPGDIALVGFRSDVAAVILGYLPTNYFQQTSDEEKPTYWGTMRRIEPGEFTRKSLRQAEIYQDKAGAVQIIAKAQPVEGSEAVDGSATSTPDDIDPRQVPEDEIVRLIIGEAYNDDTFQQRLLSWSGKKVVFGAMLRDGEVFQVFDADGNYEVVANSVNLYQQNEEGDVSLISINSVGQITLWDQAGNQIVLDAPNQKIVISSENGDNIVMGLGNIQIATKSGTNIVLDDDADNVTITAQTINLNGGQVSLGAQALASLGMDAVVTLSRLATIFNAHTHAASGAGVPNVPMTLVPGIATCPGSPTTLAT